jgi:hypothetical protein
MTGTGREGDLTSQVRGEKKRWVQTVVIATIKDVIAKSPL